MLESFIQDPDTSLLFAANGIDNPVAWDGFANSFFPMGMIAPTVGPTMTGSGAGQIVGTYFAYERWIDQFNNPSNLSPISATFTASGFTGTITGCTANTPIVITSPGHGLPTGAWVKITGVGGITTANNTWQVTAIDANHFSLNTSAGDGFTTYSGGGTWISGISTINYSGVQAPTDPKVVRRQILRNTDGQATTFYVDIDTTDLLATTFSSTLIDSLLSANTAVPLLDKDGAVFANANDPPSNYFSVISQQLDLMFMAVLVEYNVGSCSVTFGSAVVVGCGTNWKATMASRFLYVQGASKYYEIASVDPVAQTLTLTTNYRDSTDLFAFYAIKPPPAFRRIVQYSLAGFGQSWFPGFGLSIQETGDEFTGLMPIGSYLYILERRHIHKLTFGEGPAIDGAVFLTCERGCVNNRSWIAVDGVGYLMDELGIYKFSGNGQVESLSDGIQSIFRGDSEDGTWKINWHWKEFFHADLDRQRGIIRWFVSMDGSRYPKHVIGLQYHTGVMTIEEYPIPIGGACSGWINS